MNAYLSELGGGLRELIFPRVCVVCGRAVESGLEHLCLVCRAGLTTLDLHTLPENEMTDRFWGRLPVARAAALLPYTDGAPAQRLMWLLKYDERPQIGVGLGAWLGRLIAESADVFGPVDVLLPVPLHPRKLRSRGYNQAERIAAGMAEALGAEVLAGAVRRTRYTDTQTKKSRFARMENVAEVFALADAAALRDRHILLVDDVMTTGATLEALGQVVQTAAPASLKVATLALARK